VTEPTDIEKAVENARQYGYFDGLHNRTDAGMNEFEPGLEQEAYLAGHQAGFTERVRVNATEAVEDRRRRTIATWPDHPIGAPEIAPPTSSWRERDAFKP
jgi:hypothetical protein